MTRDITIVGAGWAGLAAAVKATQLGLKVHLFDAANAPGGRAKSVAHQGQLFDNGQHALIGAYSETLGLIQTMGLQPQALFERQAMKWQYPRGECYALPQDAYPLKALRSLLFSKRFSVREKSTLLKPLFFSVSQALWGKTDDTVAHLFQGVSPKIMRDIISPLCLSALNTPVSVASANTYMRVLKDAFANPPQSCEFLFPRLPLSDIFPLPCLNWLRERGARIQLNHRIDDLQDLDPHVPAILAVPPWQASLLTHDKYPQWSMLAKHIKHRAIASIYVKGLRAESDSKQAPSSSYPGPLMCLNDHDESEDCVHPQFGLQRDVNASTRNSHPEGAEHWALIVSAADPNARQTIIENALKAACEQLKLSDVQLELCTVEKRATFSCDAHLQRPPCWIDSGLMAAGDYVQGPYPGTLEGAVRSGFQAVTQLVDASFVSSHAGNTSRVL